MRDDTVKLMRTGSKDPTEAVWDDSTAAAQLVQNKRSCKSRLAANDAPCMGREGNGFESFGTVELAAS